ncbi:MAG: hypothetical protein K1X85_03095 [Ignavibacteria bacterium]|nr:hypothetical protein [Ignavibacteria bacterium]
MNWKLVMILVAVGAVMAVLSVYGVLQSGFELIIWILFGLISAYLIAKTGGRMPFVEGVVVGILSGLVNAVIQSAMFNTYLLNNPESLDGFRELPVAMQPQYVLLFAGPFIGLIYGIVLGIIALSLRKIISSND